MGSTCKSSVSGDGPMILGARRAAPASLCCGRPDVTVAIPFYWKVIISVRLSVVAFGFKGSFAKFALPEFKTL